MIKKRKILIVVANYYRNISRSLLNSAKKSLMKAFKIEVKTVPGVFEIKSKCGVSPLITHPKAMKASYFLIFFEITTGISKTPGT